MSNINTIVQKRGKIQITGSSSRSMSLLFDFRALVRTIPDASNYGPLFAFNDGEAELALKSQRCNVVTLRRRDVEASRCYLLLNFILVDPTS